MAGDREHLGRSLGRFFGEIAKAVRSPGGSDRREVKREVEQREDTLPDGRRVTLRRTTIEEIEFDDSPAGEARPDDARERES